MNSLYCLILLGWVVVFIFMSILWLYGRRKNNYNIVDVGWAISLFLLCLVYVIFGDGYFYRKLILLVLVGVWSFRLGGYLFFTRVLGEHQEDQRYFAFRKDYGSAVHRKFFTNVFQLQGLLNVVLSLPFLFPNNNEVTYIEKSEYIGVVLVFLGIIGEGIADKQLHKFKSNSKNYGKNCEVGLWFYSRHPNYFSEWIVWIGFGVFSSASPYGYWGLISTFIMFILLTKISGIPLAEKYALSKRPIEYRKYIQTTSSFIPWFKKR